MNGGDIAVHGNINTQASAHMQSTVSMQPASRNRVAQGIQSIRDYFFADANSVALLMEEAADRASKPWFQRLPGDE